MDKDKNRKLFELDASVQLSSFSIKRNGKRISLTNGEVLDATRSLLHRLSSDAIQYFAEIYERELKDNMDVVIEENIVNTVLNEVTREVLELANKAIGGEDAPPVDYLLGLD